MTFSPGDDLLISKQAFNLSNGRRRHADSAGKHPLQFDDDDFADDGLVFDQDVAK